MTRIWLNRLATALIVTVLAPRVAQAQADEIQVYDGGLAAVGTFNLTWHNNWTPIGIKTPEFAGGVVADHSFNGVPEWAYGVTRWFEAGLYLPLYTVDKHSGFGLNGFKLRTLFAVPNADNRRFFYGANMEFSYNAQRWDSTRFTSEVRPIIGWHLKPVDVIVNPIVDTAYDGLKNLEFVPAFRVAYTTHAGYQVAVEEYADYGPVHDMYGSSDQVHQIYGVVDWSAKGFDFEAGVGVGITEASDKLTFKLIVARDLHVRKGN